MEFTYRVSEADYLLACKTVRKSRRPAVVKTVLFWAFIVICLILLFTAIQRSSSVVRSPSNPSQTAEDTSTEPSPAPEQTAASNRSLVMNVAPLGLFFAIWIGLIFIWMPLQLRRMYRRDTNLHGDFTVTLDLQSFSVRTSVGTASQSGWNAFKDWKENRGMFLLRYPSGTVQILNATGLTTVEQDELRGILTAALPKK